MLIPKNDVDCLPGFKTGKLKLANETITSLLNFSGEGFAYRIVQRLLDILISLIVLILTTPIMLVIAIVIKLDSPGTTIFRQARTGNNRRKRTGTDRRKDNKADYNGIERRKSERRNENLFGKQFVFYKFRTMYVDAREQWPELYDYTYTEEELKTLTLKGKNDPRVTQVGKWLRRTSLDELPNFINVLKGEMHLVGPRPDICEIVSCYPQYHLKKFDVKPGVTGLAQIQGRNKLTFFNTNEKDIEYVKNRSLALDLKIIFKTILVVIKGDNGF